MISPRAPPEGGLASEARLNAEPSEPHPAPVEHSREGSVEPIEAHDSAVLLKDMSSVYSLAPPGRNPSLISNHIMNPLSVTVASTSKPVPHSEVFNIAIVHANR